MSSSHHSLSAASENRKARLAQLKSLKRKQPADEGISLEASQRSTSSRPPPDPSVDPSEQEPDVARLHLSGRNYDPETRGPKLGFEAPPTLGLEKPTLEEQARGIEVEVKEAAAKDASDDKGVDLFKLQPKKPNWDLKRNLDQKMEILNVRTDNAIARLVRDRITAAQKAALKTGGGGEADGDPEAAGVDGVALVEGLRIRQQEEEEEERRERAEMDALST